MGCGASSDERDERLGALFRSHLGQHRLFLLGSSIADEDTDRR
jgi:hypothetical protein